MKNKIKQLIEFVKIFYAELMIIVGSGIFVRSLLNFSYETYISGRNGLCLPKLLECTEPEKIIGVAYYYSNNTLFWIMVGTVLILSGILILKKDGRYK